MAQPKGLPLEKNFVIDNGVRDKNHVYKDGEYIEVPYVHQAYPARRYHVSLESVIVESEAEDKEVLAKGYVAHCQFEVARLAKLAEKKDKK